MGKAKIVRNNNNNNKGKMKSPRKNKTITKKGKSNAIKKFSQDTQEEEVSALDAGLKSLLVSIEKKKEETAAKMVENAEKAQARNIQNQQLEQDMDAALSAFQQFSSGQ